MTNNKDPRICWVTATYFLDVDLPVVPKLMEHFKIDWHVITTPKLAESDSEYIRSKTDKPFSIHISEGKFYSHRLYGFYRDFIKNISSKDYDWYYFDISDYFFLFPLIKKYLGTEQVTIATHNVSIPKGARLPLFAKYSMRYILKNFSHFQVFSKNQQSVIRDKTRDADVFLCPLMLKDYGEVKRVESDGITRFLFFGNIIPYKRLDLLLEAVNILSEKGIKNFHVDVAGYCRPEVWGKQYEPLIKHPELVGTDIRRIPNELVGEYFGKNDYFVMPYQDIAQSGAMTVALNYNMPIIASDLETFREFITHGQDSYLFAPGDAKALAYAMEWAINNSEAEYCRLKKNLRDMVNDVLSEERILNNYKQYFHRCLNA